MTLYQLARSDARSAGALLARAFHREALSVYMLPDDMERARVLPAHFERVVRLALTTGEVWRTEALDGVACWIAPGRWPATDAEVEAAGLGETPELVGADAWDRFRVVYEAMDHAHEIAVPEPHWILWVVGVEPGRQGQGIGSTLLRPLLARADLAGATCYLETLDERNLPLYTRHRFDVAADVVEPASTLRFWCCVRPPA